MSIEHAPKVEKIAFRIPEAVAATGLSRAFIYKLIKDKKLKTTQNCGHNCHSCGSAQRYRRKRCPVGAPEMEFRDDDERIEQLDTIHDDFEWPHKLCTEPTEGEARWLLSQGQGYFTIVRNQNLLNATLASRRNPDVVERNRPPPRPQKKQYALAYIRAAVRKECAAIAENIGTPEDRLRSACRSLSRFIGAGLSYKQAVSYLVRAALGAGIRAATVAAVLNDDLDVD